MNLPDQKNRRGRPGCFVTPRRPWFQERPPIVGPVLKNPLSAVPSLVDLLRSSDRKQGPKAADHLRRDPMRVQLRAPVESCHRA